MNQKPITMLDLADRYGIVLVQVECRPLWRKCCCPFHEEKIPSFYVMTETNSFRCLGCGASGDMIAFMARMENLTFPDAVERLASLQADAGSVPAAATTVVPVNVPRWLKPAGEPRRPVRRPVAAERLRGIGLDLRDCAGDAEVDKDDLLALANRIDLVAAELEAQT